MFRMKAGTWLLGHGLLGLSEEGAGWDLKRKDIRTVLSWVSKQAGGGRS